MIKVVFPGSFDPPTKGHLDIIRRCSRIFDSVTVLIAEHPTKKGMFTINERLELLNEMIKDFSNVSVDYYDGLVVKYAEHNEISVIVRGLRNNSDYQYEYELDMANKVASNSIETFFINATPGMVSIKSSLVKELFGYSVDVSSFVTPNVYEAMKRRQ
ncbi:pantetheine-phosphate adenylyltransferase [Thiospirochaeta perfilievii]|uniref:Phosphopantetheine adenylyltransferase n=1 Tax=Thiospirochaeta perfilievii TaxID=252967 RepID=A0A5C1QCP5_9SPIO|nr:pantetheine-phosphate adenylyltransferase [Thiospirochaeta perfilievii]QEN05873.1 pantetheine-phosphate adenylyltransferase [Thiospirochaeta perfilievii]